VDEYYYAVEKESGPHHFFCSITPGLV